jgi:hypothetical protein
MPKPPPRLSSGTGAVRDSSACAARSRSADSANPAESKICEPMWQCRPTKSSEGRERMRSPNSTARSRETPNFWSSCAVARNSCVDACTPELTRRRTRCTSPACAAASATRSISISLSITIVPTPAVTARSISPTDLLLPWNPRRRGSAPAARATASSPPVQTSIESPASLIQRTTAPERNALPA